ncbi:MAG: stringent starvation protein B [Gammaproteobacteria bacterium]|jgi:stringent starvation protein B
MTSTRPYLLRALYEWMIDNGLTPHLLVDAKAEHVDVPRQYVENDKIVLNITPDAIQDLNIGNEFLSFNARFAGKSQHILTPVAAVLAIYAKENGEGMVFPEEETEVNTGSPNRDSPVPTKKPHLKVIK